MAPKSQSPFVAVTAFSQTPAAIEAAHTAAAAAAFARPTAAAAAASASATTVVKSVKRLTVPKVRTTPFPGEKTVARMCLSHTPVVIPDSPESPPPPPPSSPVPHPQINPHLPAMFSATQVCVDFGIVNGQQHTVTADSWIKHQQLRAVDQAGCIRVLIQSNMRLKDELSASRAESTQQRDELASLRKEMALQRSLMQEMKSMMMQLDTRVNAATTKLTSTILNADRYTVDTDAKTEPAGLMDDGPMIRIPTDAAAALIAPSLSLSSSSGSLAGSLLLLPATSPTHLSEASRILLDSHAASQTSVSPFNNAFSQFLCQPVQKSFSALSHAN